MLDMQVGLLTLLKEMDAICRKHGITYYLEGGSLLGAIRHKGFLPWDDDIDLCITRDNFKKLLSVIDEELPANRELYCYERFPGYLRDTVKYTNLDTTVLFPNHILDGNAAGQHIDLFILDPVPNDKAQQEEYKKLATVYSELLSPVYVLCSDVVHYMDTYNHYLQLMEEQGREAVLKTLREKLFSLEDGPEIDTYLLRWGNRHSFYPKAFFGTPIDVPFEDGIFPAPEQYYRFLRAEFGDTWMIVPDAAHQEEHSTYDNYNVPCSTFIADYASFIDYKKLWHEYSVRKQYNMDLLGMRIQQQKDNALQQSILQELNLDPMLSALTSEARALRNAHKYEELVTYFQPYFDAQLNKDLLNHDIAIRINKDVLQTAVHALIMTGRLGQAEKILRVNGDYQSKLMQFVHDVRACMLAAEEDRYQDAKKLAVKCCREDSLQLNTAAFLIHQDLRSGQDPAQLITRTQKLMSFYPQSDELMLLMGHLLAAQGNTDEALEWYRQCEQTTRNGLYIMELQKILPTNQEEAAEADEKGITEDEQ